MEVDTPLAEPTTVLPEAARARPLKQVESDVNHQHPVRISETQKCAFKACPNASDSNTPLTPCPFCYGATLYCSKNCQLSDLLSHKMTCESICSRVSKTGMNAMTQQRLKQLGLRKQKGLFELAQAILENSELVNAIKEDVFFIPLSFDTSDSVRGYTHIKHWSRNDLAEIKESSSCIRQAVDWIEKHHRESRASDEERQNYEEQISTMNREFTDFATRTVDEQQTVAQAKAELKGKPFVPLTSTERILKIVELAKKERAKPANKRTPFLPDDYLYLVSYPPDMTFAFVIALPANPRGELIGRKPENALIACHCRMHKPM